MEPMADQIDACETSELCFANATLVLEDQVITGTLQIVGDRIAEVREGDGVPAGAVDCGGDILLPGLIELHTDNLERHLEPRPGVKLPHVPAILAHDGELASTGITTVFDALRTGSNRRRDGSYRRYSRQVASEILALRDADTLKVRHMIHLRAEVCSETLVNDLAEFGPEDRVGIVSMMDHTPGQRQFRDLSKLKDYFVGKYAYTDADFADLVERRSALDDRVRDDHERVIVAEAARLGATLASHDDTLHEHVAKSNALGVQIAEFPTTFEAAEACREAGIPIMVGAPNLIRGGSHSGNVSAVDLADAGLLDVVSSDYVPSLLVSSVFSLASLWKDLSRAAATVTSTPAEATGLTDRGRLSPDMLADIVRVHMLGDVPVVRSVLRGGRKVA